MFVLDQHHNAKSYRCGKSFHAPSYTKNGVSQSWLARIETGREVPNLKRLQQIARALGVKVNELIPY